MKRIVLLAVIIAVASLSAFAQAPCPGGTLANVLGTSCTIGNLTFNFANNFQGSLVIQDILGNIQTIPLAAGAIGFTPVQSANQAGFLLNSNFADSTNGTGLTFSQHNITFSFSPQVDGVFEILGESSTLAGNIADVTPTSSDGIFAFDGRCFTNQQCMSVQPMVSSGPQNGQVNTPSVNTTIAVPALAGITAPTGFTTEVDSFSIGGGEATLNSVSFLYTVVPQTPLPRAAKLRYKNIDLPGEQSNFAFAINNRGDIAGTLTDLSGATHGYVTDRDGDNLTLIDFPGAAATFVNGINNRGDFVGQYTNDAGVIHGFVLKDGSFSTLDFPNSIFNAPEGINDHGEITGFFQVADTAIHSYRFDDGNFTTIDDPNAFVANGPNNEPITVTEIFSINDRGTLAGLSTDMFGFSHSFLLSHGVFHRIDIPAAVEGTAAVGLNDFDEVVGQFTDINGTTHGFRLSHDDFRTVDFPNAADTFASQINSPGSIVGTYTDTAGGFHSFLAEPKENDDDSGADASTAAPQSSVQNGAATLNPKAPAKPCGSRQPVLPNSTGSIMNCGSPQ